MLIHLPLVGVVICAAIGFRMAGWITPDSLKVTIWLALWGVLWCSIIYYLDPIE